MSKYDSATRRRRPGPLYNFERIRMRPVPTTVTILETNTTGTGTVFLSMRAQNYTATAAWFKVYVTDSPTTSPTEEDLVFPQTSLAPNEMLSDPFKYQLDPGDTIWCKAQTAASVSLWCNLEIEV